MSARSMSGGFGRCIHRATGVAAVMITLLFAAICGRLLLGVAKKQAVDRARLVALAIRTDSTGALGTRIDRLRAESDAVLAVAVLDAHATPYLYYPDSTGFRSAVMRGATANGRAVADNVTIDGVSAGVWCVSVRLARGSERSVQRIVVVLRRGALLYRWAVATCMFGLSVAAILCLASHRHQRWFERFVVVPLGSLARPWRGDLPRPEWFHGLRTAGWQETTGIVNNIFRLRDIALETDAWAERTKRVSHGKIRDVQRGAAGDLRRAMDDATTDALTGLRNRRCLDAELPRLIQTVRAEQCDLAVIMFDLDNFKQLNDTRGHSAGDEMLRFVGELLRSVIRHEDIAVRLGGDEFLLILPRTTAHGASHLAERVVKLLAQYTAGFRPERPVTMSAGVASLEQIPQADATSLMTCADAALYLAKHKGKNSVATCGGA